jgi:hypothetical protein
MALESVSMESCRGKKIKITRKRLCGDQRAQ